MEVVTSGTNIDCPKLAIDSSGNPFILVSKDRIFIPPMLSYLFLYYKSNGSWIADTFEVNAQESFNADLTVDRYNRVWCIYRIQLSDTLPRYLIVACKDSLGWRKDTVDSGDFYYWESIVNDTLDTPHITFPLWNPYGRSIYAHLADTIWQKEVVDSSIGDYCCSIDLDSYSKPHISYFRDTMSIGENLWYAKKTDSIWHCEEVDHTMYASWWPTSIRVGPNDLPGIAYRDPNTYQMKYAWHDGINWHIDTLAIQGGIGTQRALDIDSLNQPWLIYSDVDYPSNVVAYKDIGGMWHKYSLPSLTLPLSLSSPGALRINRNGAIHLTRLATNNDYTIREVQYIYGTPTGIEESYKVYKNIECFFCCFPNPFTENTIIHYQLGTTPDDTQGNQISLKIYDVAGRLVKTLVNGHLQNRSAYITWNRRDENNQVVNSGIYFCELKTKIFSKTIKLVVL